MKGEKKQRPSEKGRKKSALFFVFQKKDTQWKGERKKVFKKEKRKKGFLKREGAKKAPFFRRAQKKTKGNTIFLELNFWRPSFHTAYR